jgi:hypothetical protein
VHLEMAKPLFFDPVTGPGTEVAHPAIVLAGVLPRPRIYRAPPPGPSFGPSPLVC